MGRSTVTKTGDSRSDVRVDDLVSRMTLEEKAGLMLIDTMGAGLRWRADGRRDAPD